MTPQQFVEMVARFTPTGEDDEDNRTTLARLIDEASTIVSDLPPPTGDVGELIAWLRFHGQNDPAHDDDAPQNIAAKRQREAAAEIERLRAALRTIADGKRDADQSYATLFAEVVREARAALLPPPPPSQGGADRLSLFDSATGIARVNLTIGIEDFWKLIASKGAVVDLREYTSYPPLRRDMPGE